MIHTTVVFLKLVTMGLEFIVAAAAMQAYFRYVNKSLFYVAVGFMAISLGVGLEGVIIGFTDVSLYSASLVQTTLMALGIVCVLYSIYGDTPTRATGWDEWERTW